MRITAPIWKNRCDALESQLTQPPSRNEAEPWRIYHQRLTKLQDERIQGIGNRLRETYEERKAMIHSSKLIGPRRNVTALGSKTTQPEPLGSVSARSSLMKKSKMETLSRYTTAKSSQKPVTKMIPPKKRY